MRFNNVIHTTFTAIVKVKVLMLDIWARQSFEVGQKLTSHKIVNSPETLRSEGRVGDASCNPL